MVDVPVNSLPTMPDAVMARVPIELADNLRPLSSAIGDLVIEPTVTGVAMSISAGAVLLQDGRTPFSPEEVDALIEMLAVGRDATLVASIKAASSALSLA